MLKLSYCPINAVNLYQNIDSEDGTYQPERRKHPEM
jgi:hypothetical protein